MVKRSPARRLEEFDPAGNELGFEVIKAVAASRF
jgi:hypothetical protein